MAWDHKDHTWTPPSLCSTGIEETIAALGIGAAAAPEAAAVAAPPILAAGLPAVAATAPAAIAPIAAAAPAVAAGGGLSSVLAPIGIAASVGGTAASFLG